jgi:hypothetical protein
MPASSQSHGLVKSQTTRDKNQDASTQKDSTKSLDSKATPSPRRVAHITKPSSSSLQNLRNGSGIVKDTHHREAKQDTPKTFCLVRRREIHNHSVTIACYFVKDSKETQQMIETVQYYYKELKSIEDKEGVFDVHDTQRYDMKTISACKNILEPMGIKVATVPHVKYLAEQDSLLSVRFVERRLKSIKDVDCFVLSALEVFHDAPLVLREKKKKKSVFEMHKPNTVASLEDFEDYSDYSSDSTDHSSEEGSGTDDDDDDDNYSTYYDDTDDDNA